VNQRNWDSLAHVSLVAAIESEFNMTLDAADALRMTSYRATELLLEEKGL
jgi:acyl carrier protein